MGRLSGRCRFLALRPFLAGLTLGAAMSACDPATSEPGAARPDGVGTQHPEAKGAAVGPVQMSTEFTRDEVLAGALVLTGDPADAEALASELLRPPHGASLDPDHEFLTVLALTSDDLAVRVGRLRGLGPEQARTWARELLAEAGHPSTWEVERIEDEG